MNKISEMSGEVLILDRQSQESLCQVFDKLNVDEGRLRELLKSNKELEPALKAHYISRILTKLRFTDEIVQ